MNLFNFGVPEFLSFFCVLVRTSVLCSVLPIIGNKLVPGPVKVLLALSMSIAIFPALVHSNQIRIQDAAVWGRTTSGLVSMVALETLVGLLLGFTSKLVFDALSFGANMVGNLMGFGSASSYDPHQESQTEVIAQIQTTLAMLLFLALDGHLFMLKATLESYRVLGIGRVNLGQAVSHKLVQMTAEVFRFGLQLAGPVAISLFAVNIVFGIISKALPQVNILVLSFSISAFVGFSVMLFSMNAFFENSTDILARVVSWTDAILAAMAGSK